MTTTQLAFDEVHAWCTSLDVPPEISARLYATLSPDERARSARFRFEHDRRRFIVARGILRDLLGRSLEIEPGEIRFVYNEFGKPDLGPEFGSQLKFNLSHSENVLALAVAFDRDVGIDIEVVRPIADVLDLAATALPVRDCNRLRALAPSARDRAFYRMWTRREALVKRNGCGLTAEVTEDLPGKVNSFKFRLGEKQFVGACAS